MKEQQKAPEVLYCRRIQVWAVRSCRLSSERECSVRTSWPTDSRMAQTRTHSSKHLVVYFFAANVAENRHKWRRRFPSPVFEHAYSKWVIMLRLDISNNEGIKGQKSTSTEITLHPPSAVVSTGNLNCSASTASRSGQTKEQLAFYSSEALFLPRHEWSILDPNQNHFFEMHHLSFR